MNTTAITTLDEVDSVTVDRLGLWLQSPAGTWTLLPGDPPNPMQAAFQRIERGQWVIDPDTGIVTGKRGRPIGHTNPKGYVELYLNLPELPGNPWRQVYAHRLIWQRYRGPIPAGLQVNHIDGGKDHNWLANLEVLSGGDNVRHAFRTGLSGHTPKLGPDKVREVRAVLAETDGSYRITAARTGATIRQVIGIAQGITFQRVR